MNRKNSLRCKYCGRKWFPHSGITLQRPYCQECSAERKRKAILKFGDFPITLEELKKPHIVRPYRKSETV